MKLLLLFILFSVASYGQGISCKSCIESRGLHKYFFASIDTPQTDRKLNDFYGQDDGLIFGNYTEPDTNTYYSVKYNLTKEQVDSVDEGRIILLYRPQLSFEEKLLQYAQECWNDSTLMFEQISCPDKIVGCAVFHGREYWHHRKPTFEGFIQWLKKK